MYSREPRNNAISARLIRIWAYNPREAFLCGMASKNLEMYETFAL
jgi:hypothetical protein